MKEDEPIHLQTCKEAGVDIFEPSPEEWQVWADALRDSVLEKYRDEVGSDVADPIINALSQ